MKKYSRSLAIALSLVAISCVKNESYNIPKVTATEPNIKTNTTIDLVKKMYKYPYFEFQDDLIVSGYVISNDEADNFYQTLVIQDAAKNPTAGIKIDIAVSSLYTHYKPGRKVYIKLKGLGINKPYGMLHIGVPDGSWIKPISAANYTDYIVRSTEVATIVPKKITLDSLEEGTKDNLIDLLVEIEHMQLIESEVGKAYTDSNSYFNTDRNLESCNGKSQIVLRNSKYANFRGYPFPKKQGTIIAVFEKDKGTNLTFEINKKETPNAFNYLVIRDTNDIKFEEDRCSKDDSESI